LARRCIMRFHRAECSSAFTPADQSRSPSLRTMSARMNIALGTSMRARSICASEMSNPKTSNPVSARTFVAGIPAPQPRSRALAPGSSSGATPQPRSARPPFLRVSRAPASHCPLGSTVRSRRSPGARVPVDARVRLRLLTSGNHVRRRYQVEVAEIMWAPGAGHLWPDFSERSP
jgi:hypothetical protein